jgi:hypothetical protein
LLFAPAHAAAQASRTSAEKQAVAKIVYQRKMTWRFQDRAHHKRSLTTHRERRAALPVLHRLAHYWEHRHYLAWSNWYSARYTRTLAVVSALPPHYSSWLCIHGGEGSWTSNTGNGYYGGLQMDYGFMSSYGGALLASKGTADHWTPLEQMWVAERAYSSGRGFYPWPNTARACGLI